MAEPNVTLAAPRVWSVGALLLAVADALAARFTACVVQGELSGVTRAASGHFYFTLKDAGGAAAAVRCAMFRRSASLLDFAPRDGQQVELRGRVTVYEPRGEMQLVVESMRPLGAGSLYEHFLRLKARLEAEGLFDSARKRPLPVLAQRIGIVTSLAGAALHDLLTTLARRAPQVRVIVYPSLVQGPEAPAALVAALAKAAGRREVDLLIVARGGGSIEDLWAFNDERVVRALAAMPMPVIAGVGHETDVTLADFVADLRAPTPTAAAELALPARDELLAGLTQIASRLAGLVARRLDAHAERLDRLALQLARPTQRLASARQQLQALAFRAARAIRRGVEVRAQLAPRLHERLRAKAALRLSSERVRLAGLGGRLAALDPTAVLARGYAIVQAPEGGPLTRPEQLHAGQDLTITLAQGAAAVRLASARKLPAKE